MYEGETHTSVNADLCPNSASQQNVNSTETIRPSTIPLPAK